VSVLLLIETFGGWAAVISLGTAIGGAVAPPFTKLPKIDLSVGDAAAWGLTWGFLSGCVMGLILPTGFVG